MAENRTWIVEHSGHYLGGFSIAFAETRDDAKKAVLELLEAAKLAPIITKIYEPVASGATMIWDGDY